MPDTDTANTKWPGIDLLHAAASLYLATLREQPTKFASQDTKNTLRIEKALGHNWAKMESSKRSRNDRTKSSIIL